MGSYDIDLALFGITVNATSKYGHLQSHTRARFGSTVIMILSNKDYYSLCATLDPTKAHVPLQNFAQHAIDELL